MLIAGGMPRDSNKSMVNYYDLLKIIALLTMVVDHVGFYFYPDIMWIRAIGRMAFPLFLFLVGYSHAYTVKNSLIAGCLLLVVVDAWTYYPLLPINILGTIIAVRLLFAWAVRKGWLAFPFWQIFLVLAVWFPVSAVLLEYGSVAAMYALAGYYARFGASSHRTMLATLALATVFHGLTQMLAFEFGALENAIMALMLLLAAAAMTLCSVDPVRAGPVALQRVIRFLSRRALLIYVLHITAFQLIETWLHPGPTSGTIWMQ